MEQKERKFETEPEKTEETEPAETNVSDELDAEPEAENAPEPEVSEDASRDGDEDIDSFIHELTGRGAAPTIKPKTEDAPKAPEHEVYRVTSLIGEDDHKAFIWYSTLFRYRWALPLYILVPIVAALLFSFVGGAFYIGNFVLSLVIVYAIMALLIVFRCTRWVSKIRKSRPETLRLTETTLVFMTESVINMKNGNRIRVGYSHMIDAKESGKRFILYFDNGKAMVFRKEDMPTETLEAFRPFILSKVHRKTRGISRAKR